MASFRAIAGETPPPRVPRTNLPRSVDFHLYSRRFGSDGYDMRSDFPIAGNQRASGLVDLLDRVLDKGLAIAGDIKVSLAEVELLTIRIRLIICSIDKAQEIGLDWWKYDPNLTRGARQRLNQNGLADQVRRLERKVAALSAKTPAARRRALKRPERGTGNAG